MASMTVAKMCYKCLMCRQVVIIGLHCLCCGSEFNGMLLARPQDTRAGGNGKTTVPKMLAGRGGS